MAKYMDSGGLSHFMSKLKGKYGEPEAPYTEVEWVESNGKQFVYLDWKPPIATWGFEIDFQNFNAVNTSMGAWNAATNKDGYGGIFGTMNSTNGNDIRFTTYNNGYLRIGGGNVTSGFRTDKTRQTIKLHGTTLTKSDGTTVTVARASEAANKPYANMTVFCWHNGLRRSGSGALSEPGSTRIYSLKFYDSNALECDLVGAIRKRDKVTGLYDKIAGKFYPAPGCTYGSAVGDLGDSKDISSSLNGVVPYLVAYNDVNTRMLRVDAPMLDKLEDGQAIRLTYLYAISSSVQTTELAGWDDTSNNSNVYIKLTLSDGSTTEWIPCYYNAYTRLTTHYYAGAPLLLTYRENVFIDATATSAGTSVLRGFWVDQDNNTDDTYTRYSDTLIAGLNGVKRYSLNMRDVNGNWTSIMNQDNNTNSTGKTAYTGGLMLGNVLYHISSANVAAGGNTGRMKESQGGVDFRYDVNGVVNAATTELQLRKPIYLVGTVGSDGLFYLDTTKWWTQTPDQTGKVYVQLGTAYSSYYAIFLSVDNPSFIYDGTKLVSYTPGNIGGTASNVTGTVAIANGGTGQTTAANAWTALGGGSIGKKNSLSASDIPAHASSATTYGTGSSSNYGHVKLSDSTSSTSGTSGGIAATPSAVKSAYDHAHEAYTGMSELASMVVEGLYFDTTYTVSNGTYTFAAHVYNLGDEVTDSFDATCFEWSYRTVSEGTPTYTSLGTGKTKAVAISTLGLGGYVKCDFTPDDE